MKVELEDDALPIVRVIGALARRSLTKPSVVQQVRRAKGVAVLQSAEDPQAVTFHLDGKTVRLERGAAAGADVTITADLADDSVKPTVVGAARHPLVALSVAKLLEPPIGPWRAEANEFLCRALENPLCPRPIRVVATDGGASQQWGGDGDPAIEIHGPSDRLAHAMSGSSLLIEDVLAGKLWCVGDLRDLSVFSRFTFDHMFGEL